MDWIEHYLNASPVLDPDFVALRREIFGHGRDWLELENAIFDRQRVRVSGLPVALLGPALGWELPPWSVTYPKDAKAILRVLSERRGWDLSQWNCVSEREADDLEAEARHLGLGFKSYPFPIAVIGGDGGYAGYLKRRSSSMNRNQRGAFRKITEAGLEFRTELGWQDIERVLDVRAVEFSNGVDYTQTPEFRTFLKAYRERMTQAGRWVETGLYDGEKLVAFDLGFRSGEIFHSYQTGFDPDYARYRAGNATFEKTLERVLEGGVLLIDLMGDNPYFANFTRESLPMKRVAIYSRSWKGRALSFLMNLRGR